MGFLGTAAMRFIRTKWKNTQSLAEELFATFSGELDISPQSITINQRPGTTLPPIQINQPADSTTPGIQINRGGTVVNVGGGGGGGGGGVDLADVEWPEQEPGDAEEATPPSALNPISLHGRVLQRLSGTGSFYKVRCWAKNPAVYPPIGVLTVEFPDVDPDDTIPSGARVPIIMFPKIVLNVVQPDYAVGYIGVWYEES